MNKPLLALFLGLLIFSAGGMQGRLGSLLAVFIDPASLQDLSPNAGNTPPLTNQPITVPAGPGNSCPPGYTYDGIQKVCVNIAGAIAQAGL